MKLVIALNVILLFSYGDTVDLAGIDIAHELMHKGQRSRAYTVAVNYDFTPFRSTHAHAFIAFMFTRSVIGKRDCAAIIDRS